MLLLLTLLVPLVFALLLCAVPSGKTGLHKTLATVGSVVAFGVSLALWFSFDKTNPGFQFTTNWMWIPSLDIGFRLGIDGMSLLMVVLTTFIFPIAIIASYDSIRDRQKMYYIMILLLQFGLLGVFVSLDTFLFYIFWEVVLIPMYFLIGIWGGKDRIYAAMKFFLYTMAGSLLMLVAIIYLGQYGQNGGFTGDMQKLMTIAPTIPMDAQQWLFLAFALSFCIKVPLFPLHTWLSDAHTQAPTAGSVILAGVMLKMGTYGLIRFNLQLFPQASLHYADLIAVLSVIGIIYGALVAMVQTDIKKLVAYSSVAHMGFVTLGIFSMTAEGVQGAVLQMVNHGLSTGMLFLLIGVIYERRHTREMSEFGGLAKSMPVYATFFFIAVLASVGLPGLNGFVGEYLTLIGAYLSDHLGSKLYAVVAASGVILAAVYLLILFQKMFFGPLAKSENSTLKDLTGREIGMFVPIVILCLWIGFQPNTFLSVSETSSRAVVGVIEGLKGENRYADVAAARLNPNAPPKPVPVQGMENMKIAPPGTPLPPSPVPMPSSTKEPIRVKVPAGGGQVQLPPPKR
ncbi:MAG: NADH-quinone oxidoreductase subunit M [Chlorobi bacterium]|jgi:NADH-quinone oxidoreductase subunit M|nr:NADH-quinone oxidoreductase subunit M [Chlorobiota bacterium]